MEKGFFLKKGSFRDSLVLLGMYLQKEGLKKGYLWGIRSEGETFGDFASDSPANGVLGVPPSSPLKFDVVNDRTESRGDTLGFKFLCQKRSLVGIL